MFRYFRPAVLIWLLLAALCPAEHLIVSGGPALRRWENLRTKRDQHDRWWANFIRSATLRMEEIKVAYGLNAPITWVVYRPGYEARGREDGKPYTAWILDVAGKYRAKLVWIRSGGEMISVINNRPAQSVQSFDYFGHSNRFCFMLDYGSEIMAVSAAWVHERDLSRIRSGVFARNAYCKSWGCHTGESMSAVWRRAVGVPLEGAKGATNYETISFGKLPSVNGSWVR